MVLENEVTSLNSDLKKVMEEEEMLIIENMDLKNTVDELKEAMVMNFQRKQGTVNMVCELKRGLDQASFMRDMAISKLQKIEEFDKQTLDIDYKDGEFRVEVKEGEKILQAMFVNKSMLDEMKEIKLHADLGISNEMLKDEEKDAARVNVRGKKKGEMGGEEKKYGDERSECRKNEWKMIQMEGMDTMSMEV